MKPAFLPFLLIAPILISCGSHEPARVSAAAPAGPVPVQIATIDYREWPNVYEASGTVRARTLAALSAKVMGHVREVNFNTGDRVRAGQTLVVLDARDLESNVRRAEAARDEVRGGIPEADNAIAAAKANLDLAQATFRRMQDLLEKKSISNQEFDETSARLKGAEANYAMARARRTQIDSRLAQVDQEIQAAAIVRDYARIAAPFSGIVISKSVEPGTLASPGAPLLTLEQEGGYRLEVSVEESRMGAIRQGQTATVTLEALGSTVESRVSEIVPAVDASSRSYIVKLDLPAMSQLRSGMFGRASFSSGVARVLTVPNGALKERGQLTSLFVVESATARTRLVTNGRRRENAVEILSGLDAGEKVIVPPPPGLSDGVRVEVRQ
jgi:RND family efflux transporter MFP subunit